MAEKFRTQWKDEPSRTNSGASVLVTPVEIEYPVEGEKIAPGHYAIRVAAEPNSHVEISIDTGPWQACRFSVGHYWYDWRPSQADKHRIAVRSRLENGSWKTSKERSCTVIGSGKN